MLKFGACDRSGSATPQPFSRLRTGADPHLVRQPWLERTVPGLPGASAFQVRGSEIRVGNPFFEDQYNRVPLRGYWFFELFCQESTNDESGEARDMPEIAVSVDVVEFGQTTSVANIITTTSLAPGLLNFTGGFRVIDQFSNIATAIAFQSGAIEFNEPTLGLIRAGISISGGDLVIDVGARAARGASDNGCMIQWIAEIEDMEDRQFQMTTTTSDEWQHLPVADFTAVKLGLCVPQ